MWKALAGVALGVAVAAVAVAQNREVKHTKPRAGEVASIEEPDFTRFRVVTDEGILVVFDADEEWDGRDEPASQLAYWHDFASEQLFFFDRLLFDSEGVLQSVAAMQRDLAIDPALLFLEKPELDPLPEITSPGLWRPADELDVVTVMAGGLVGEGPEGRVSAVDSPCVPMPCPDPEMIMSGPIAGPVRGTPRDELFALASRGGRCSCGGGGCSDPDACTNCALRNGTCACEPIHCTDWDLCTEDSCNPGGNPACRFSAPRVCPDIDACTLAQCYPLTGECRTDSSCSEQWQCCDFGDHGKCCPNDRFCCQYYYENPNNGGHPACCPPARPFCCDNGSLDTDCCQTAADCCNGDCKGPCDTVCGPDGWHQGPQCGSTWCGIGQICCNGTCCGLGPCYSPKCYPNGLCVNMALCDDGDYSTWTNTCPGHNGPLTRVEFQDSLKTWLAARHNPSGCFQVLKNFTWDQNADYQVNPQREFSGNSTTNHSTVGDGSGPGESARLDPPRFNATTQPFCP